MKKPTLQQVKDYIHGKGIGTYVDAETVFYFYESKGWKVNKNDMKCWHSAVSGWAARNKKENGPKKKDPILCEVCGDKSVGVCENRPYCHKKECKLQIRGW